MLKAGEVAKADKVAEFAQIDRLPLSRCGSSCSDDENDIQILQQVLADALMDDTFEDTASDVCSSSMPSVEVDLINLPIRIGRSQSSEDNVGSRLRCRPTEPSKHRRSQSAEAFSNDAGSKGQSHNSDTVSLSTSHTKIRETATDKAQKNCRRHRMQVKVPEFTELNQRLETVVEEQRKVVRFEDSPVVAEDMSHLNSRVGRKGTGFVREEDIAGIQMMIEPLSPSDTPRLVDREKTSKRKAGHQPKGTCFNLNSAPKSKSESEKKATVIGTESPQNRHSQRKGTRFNFDADCESELDSEAKVVSMASDSPKKRHCQRKGTRFNFDAASESDSDSESTMAAVEHLSKGDSHQKTAKFSFDLIDVCEDPPSTSKSVKSDSQESTDTPEVDA